MKGARLSSFARFLAGILLIQLATALLTVIALRTARTEIWLLLGLFALVLGLISAFWFGTIAAHAHQKATIHLKEQFARERERIRLNAERQKTRVIQKNQQQLEKERRKVEARANRKTTLMFTGMVAAGGLMIFTQFMTFGLLLMTGAGGALGGYLWRVKQQALPRRKVADPLAAEPAPRLIRKE